MDISSVLIHGWPGKEFSVGETYESLQWLNDSPKPTLQDIENVWPEVQLKISMNRYAAAIDKLLDEVAVSKSYKSQNSIVSYVNSNNELWRSQASSYIDWRDHVWETAYIIMHEVHQGLLSAPSVDEFLAQLPIINWD